MTLGMRKVIRAEWMKKPSSSSVVATPLIINTTARRTGVTLMGSKDALSTSTGVCSSRWSASDMAISSLLQPVLLRIATEVVNSQVARGEEEVRKLRRGASQREDHHLPGAGAFQGGGAGGRG